MLGALALYLQYRKRMFDHPLEGAIGLLVIMSYKTVSEYFVQSKQYSFEILFAFVMIFQLVQIPRLLQGKTTGLLPIIVLIIIPIGTFCSYTYPILLLPYLIILLLRFRQNKRWWKVGLITLIVSITSILGAYILDIQYVLSNQSLQNYWRENIFNLADFQTGLHNIWKLLMSTGSGLVLEIIFGILSALAIISAFRKWKLRELLHYPLTNLWNNYFNLLFMVVIVLYLMGKLPLANHRLNAFLLPMLMWYIIRGLQLLIHSSQIRIRIYWVVFLSLTLSILLTYSREFDRQSDLFDNKIYNSIGNGIEMAYNNKVPLEIVNSPALRGHPELVVLTHHKFKKEFPLQIIVTEPDKHAYLNQLCDRVIVQDTTVRYIKCDE